MSRASTSTPFALSQRGHRTADQPISYLMAEALRRPQLISLAAGFVDYETLPDAGRAVRELIEPILADAATARQALQYGTTQGDPELRAALVEHLAKLDVRAAAYDPDDVIVTTGSQQLLHLIADTLIDPGDLVLTAWPTYFVYTGALQAFGAQVRSVEMDEAGLIPESLDDVLRDLERRGELPRVKILYVTSYHQNPTGLTLAAERRPRIVEIIRRYSHRLDHRICIVEDAAYRELTYGAAPGGDANLIAARGADPAATRGLAAAGLPSIRSFDEDGEHVALLQTFSKPFAPGLKTGYGLLPRGLMEPIVLQKTGRDFGSSNFNQYVLNRALRSGAFAAHVKRLCAAYRIKRDAMLAALDERLGAMPGVSWTRPSGGLYVWLTLPAEDSDTTRHGPLFERALEEGVLFVPGEYCYPPDPTRPVPRNTIRLSFGVASVEQFREGVARLAQAMAAAQGRS